MEGIPFPTCKNIFQDGKEAPTPERITQVWAALINQMEQSKGIVAGSR